LNRVGRVRSFARGRHDALAAQGDTIRVEHVLAPLVVVMVGANEFDPCKD
jgi:hypothetical protein